MAANPAHADQTTARSDINARITGVGDRLASALRAVLELVPGGPHNPQELASILGVSKDTAHRLMTALRKRDPLAVTYMVPGPEPLRRVVKACIRSGVSRQQARPAEEAIREFARLIQQQAGDRSGLDAIISAWLPTARARFEIAAKQLGYRSMRQLKGIAADVTFSTTFLHPGSDPARLDHVRLAGYLGVRRVRPNAGLKIGARSAVSVALPGQDAPRTLEGEPVEDLQGVVLDRFCSQPPVTLQVHRKGQDVIYMLDWGDAVGLPSARDVVLGEVRRNGMRRYRTADDMRTKSGLCVDISVPAQMAVCDLILHDDAYPDWEPAVRVIEMGALGYPEVNDESRDMDVLDVVETVQSLGRGIDQFRCEEISDYVELLRYTCAKLGWDPGHFRGYRCQVVYPIVGSVLQLACDVPIGPSAPQ